MGFTVELGVGMGRVVDTDDVLGGVTSARTPGIDGFKVPDEVGKDEFKEGIGSRDGLGGASAEI